MKKFIEGFKAFAMRGNVLDMAVGVVIGGAFGKITTSLVNDIIMPVVSLLTNGIDFSQWKLVLQQAVVTAAGEVQTRGRHQLRQPDRCGAGLSHHCLCHFLHDQGHQQAPPQGGGARTGARSPRAQR